MTDFIKAAKKLIDCVEFDMNGAGGKGGNGGLLSDTTLRAAHDLRVIMSRETERSPAAAKTWQTMDTAPRNGTAIQAWHAVHKCPLSVLWNEDGHQFNGETLHWFERSYTTAWPESAFSHWMPLPIQPAMEGGAE